MTTTLDVLDSQYQLLLDLLTTRRIPATIDEWSEIHIRRSVIQCRIVRRPHYCDRGRWLLHAESNDQRIITIDHNDLFPRYYFHELSLADELATWLEVRLRDKL